MEPDTAAPADPAPAESGRPLRHWLLEGLFIVVSVILGFGVAQYGDYRSDRALARQMLTSIQTEVEHNKKLLTEYLAFHGEWRDRLQKADAAMATGSTLELFLASSPPIPEGKTATVPLFRRAAWDTALSTGALRLIDYDLAAGLSEIYGMQDHAIGTFTGMFGQPAFYDPNARAATIQLARTTMTEMTWAEGELQKLYEKHLPALQQAAGGR